MGSHQSLSNGTSASESAKLCFIASEYAFFQRHFMVLVTHMYGKDFKMTVFRFFAGFGE